MASLVFGLKALPLAGEVDLDQPWRAISRVLVEHRNATGIETNEHRALLIVRKQ